MDENEREVIAVEDVSLMPGVNAFEWSEWAGRLTPQATIWIGKLDNPAFGRHRDPTPKREFCPHQMTLPVGYEYPDHLAATIVQRHGPSGPNKVSNSSGGSNSSSRPVIVPLT
jgi:hypothetical protein